MEEEKVPENIDISKSTKKRRRRKIEQLSVIFNTNQFTNYSPYIRRVVQTRQPVYETGPILNVLKSKNDEYKDVNLIKPKYVKENGSDMDSDSEQEFNCD